MNILCEHCDTLFELDYHNELIVRNLIKMDNKVSRTTGNSFHFKYSVCCPRCNNVFYIENKEKNDSGV